MFYYLVDHGEVDYDALDLDYDALFDYDAAPETKEEGCMSPPSPADSEATLHLPSHDSTLATRRQHFAIIRRWDAERETLQLIREECEADRRALLGGQGTDKSDDLPEDTATTVAVYKRLAELRLVELMGWRARADQLGCK